MEQIKDIVTLRAFAYEEALRHGAGTTQTLKIAKEIESYILGDAKLPESYEDKTMDVYKDFMKNLAPKPSNSMWFEPSEILPNVGQRVLVMCQGRTEPMFGGYFGEDCWEASDADVVLRSKSNEITVVAWYPIPEYKG